MPRVSLREEFELDRVDLTLNAPFDFALLSANSSVTAGCRLGNDPGSGNVSVAVRSTRADIGHLGGNIHRLKETFQFAKMQPMIV
jgi:hypothetical protein